jgi:NADH-quinone oxidoreductase subunit C
VSDQTPDQAEGPEPAEAQAAQSEPEAAPQAEAAPEAEAAPQAESEPEPEPEPEGPPPLPEEAAMLLARLEAELGDAIVEHGHTFGELILRVAPDSWRRAAQVAREKLGCDYLSYVAGIDWAPSPRIGGDDAGGDTSAPVQPTTMTFGVAGSAGRFQVFGRVASTSKKYGVTFKTDVDEADPRAQSWVAVYPGADWHERECWEMFGIDFEGHPAIRHLYLPSEFEGHPLRKDFPLLAREVKPWPGLVDVEPMPGEEATADEGAAAAGGES